MPLGLWINTRVKNIYLIWTLYKDQTSLARMVSDSYQTSYVWLVSPKNKKTAISHVPGCYGNHGRLPSLENRANFVKTNTYSSHFYSKYKRYISKMILRFQILDLSFNKINFPFGNFSSIFTHQHGKVGQNWHLQNPLKSGGFMVISQKLHPY